MQQARPIVRAAANRQITLDQTSDEIRDIKDFFVCPPLSTQSKYLTFVTDSGADLVTLDEALLKPGNIVFAGLRESGKTSLAHYIAVRVSEGIADRPRIPVVLDFAKFEMRRPLRPRDLLRRAFTQYLQDLADEVSFRKRLEAGDFIFIADNVQLSDDERRAVFNEVLAEGTGNRWICLSEVVDVIQHGKKTFEEAFPDFHVFFINALPRRSIRELTRRWCAASHLDDRDAFTRVMAQIGTAGLPRNAYIVSLVLWALVQRRELERVNEATLLENFLEFLLEKADFRGALRREFDFRSKELLLQQIATHLKEKGGSTTVNELTTFIVNFFNTFGLDFNVNVILDKLLECRVLATENGNISFRYRCFQDYFVAGRLIEKEDELQKVLNGSELLLYAREVELLTGLSRTQSKVVDVLHARLKELEPAWMRDADLSEFDRVVLRRSATLGLQGRVEQMKKKHLSADEIDEFMDYTGRRFEEEARDPNTASKVAEMDIPRDMSTAPARVFLELLLLFAKVTRNSEFIPVKDKENAAIFFFRVLGGYMALWLKISDRMVEDIGAKAPGAPALVGRAIGDLEYVFKTFIVVFLSLITDEAIYNPKLLPIFTKIMNEKTTPTIIRMLSAFTVLDGQRRDWKKTFGALLDDIRGNAYALRILAERFYIYYRTHVLVSQERLEFEQFIAELEIALGTPPKERGRIMQALRQLSLLESDDAP